MKETDLLNHPLYHDALKKSLAETCWEGALDPKGDEHLIVVKEGTLRLYISVEKESGNITFASHLGSRNPGEKALLNQFCALMVGATPLEVSDHLAIELEWKLRDTQKPRPTKGITTPQNAHPAFDWIVSLGRRILKEYLTTTGTPRDRNFFERDCSKEWILMSDEERISKIEKSLKSRPDLFKIEGFSCPLIENEVRVYCMFAPDWTNAKRQKFLFDAEFFLRTHVERNIQLFAMEKKDENKIRHKHQDLEKV